MARPVYMAAMIFLPRTRTNAVPMIEVMMEMPPSTSGKMHAMSAYCAEAWNTRAPSSIAAIVVTQ